jgi:hypothetical protein
MTAKTAGQGFTAQEAVLQTIITQTEISTKSTDLAANCTESALNVLL